MTSRQVFEYSLIELNKVQAPSLLLEDYNYFINKAINQYINKIYNAYDLNQQKTDDIRVLKSSTILTPAINNDTGTSALFSKIYEVNLPDDYLHVLNCVVEYNVKKNFKCYNSGDNVHFGAKRLTADMFSQIINNYYMRPSYKSPYFYINNVNISDVFPTSDSQDKIGNTNSVRLATVDSPPSSLLGNYYTYNLSLQKDYFKITSLVNKTTISGTFTQVNSYLRTDPVRITRSTGSFITDGIRIGDLVYLEGPDNHISRVTNVTPTEISLDLYNDEIGTTVSSLVFYKTADVTQGQFTEKVAENRYGNKSKVRMEIRYGKDNAVFTLTKVYIDYLKAPQFIRLTQEQVDEVEDNSQILEFPDYVCQEIVNELIKLLMENASDPRLQTNIPINQSIAQPQQAPTK